MRPKGFRHIGHCPNHTFYKPRSVPMGKLKIVKLSHEELEALRLKNVLGLNQIEAAAAMQTSQSTFQRILSSAYKKISRALVEGWAIEIEVEKI